MRTSRPLAAAIAVAAATTLVAGLVPPASAATYDPKPPATGARWLAGELTGGLVHNNDFDFDDLGLSIDFALGLDGAGRKPATVQEIADAFEPHLAEYTSFETSVFAGQVAKAGVLAITAHADPTSFGGTNLVTQLEGLVNPSAPIAGRIEDDSVFGDNANVIGQTHAARLLSFAGSGAASDVTGFLLAQQCDAGFFREKFTADKARPDQSCQGAPVAERKPSTDTTALAVLALLDVKGPEARAAVDNGIDWLVGHQNDNGSFSSDGRAKTAPNANSTGLAGWAFGEAGAKRQAAKAATWLRNLQVPTANPCARKLRNDSGAIAFDISAYRKGQRNGIPATQEDQWRRASSQALPALLWAPAAEGRFTAAAPAKVGSGDRLRIRISGAAPGERVCVTGGGIREFLGKRTAITQVAFDAPSNPGRRTFKVWLGSRHREVTVRVTG
jgi:hypothetical protein